MKNIRLKRFPGIGAMIVIFIFLINPFSTAMAISQDEANSIYNDTVWYQPGGSSDANVDCSVDLVGSGNAEKIFNFLISNGLTAFQAAGVMGNMSVESGLEPQRLQGTPPGTITPAESFSGTLGWGLVQWTPGSKFINTNDPIAKANDLGVQLDFLWNQLSGNGPLPEKQAGDDVKTAPSLEEAVLAFQGNQKVGGKYFGFERPADETATVKIRTARARGFLLKFGSNDPTGAGASICDPGTNDSNFSMIKLNPPLATPGGQITPKGITLHWWGSSSGGQGIDFLARALRSNSTCGLSGCSVQIGITEDGKVYQMTQNLTDLTYHAIGGNQTTFGIEVEGSPADFGAAGVNKYPQKFAAVVATVKYLVNKYNLPLDGPIICGDVSGVHPHKAYNSCPGAFPKQDIDDAYFNALMQKVRQ